MFERSLKEARPKNSSHQEEEKKDPQSVLQLADGSNDRRGHHLRKTTT
jgi:hypothetical protein